MRTFLNKLETHGNTVAFLEEGKTTTYRQFVGDVYHAHAFLSSAMPPSPVLVGWDHTPTYVNLVALFALALSGHMVVSKQLVPTLQLQEEATPLSCSGTVLDLYPRVSNAYMTLLAQQQIAGMVIATSGTGGQPKRMVINLSQLAHKYLKLHSTYTSVLVFSLEHISGIETLLSLLAPGSTIILSTNRSPEHLTELMHQHQANLLSCTPSFLISLYLKGLMNTAKLGSLSIINSGGEALSQAWLHRFEHALPAVSIRQAFGTTETTNIRTYTHPTDHTRFKPGAVNIDYRIEDGVLWLKNKGIVLGAWEDPQPKDEPWIQTSDLVTVDDEGYICLVGRSDQVINVGGEKVQPRTVEACLMQYPGVLFARVYGQNQPLTGQMVVADVLADVSDLRAWTLALRKFCLERLPEYAVPVKFQVLKELPLTQRMKYQETKE